jgi:hypothetical protein
MLLEARLRDGIHDGSITVVFRRWQRGQVAGGRYRTGRDMVEVGRWTSWRRLRSPSAMRGERVIPRLPPSWPI